MHSYTLVIIGVNLQRQDLGRVDKGNSTGLRSMIQDYLYVGSELGMPFCQESCPTLLLSP